MSSITGNIELHLEGKNIDYVLSAGIDLKNDPVTYYMPSLSFYKDRGMLKKEKFLGVWDNEDYLENVLLKQVIEPYVKDKSIQDPEGFTTILRMGAELDDFNELKQLFDTAIKMKFFEEKQ